MVAIILSGCGNDKTINSGILLKDITIVDVVSGELLPDKQVIIKDNVIHSILDEIDNESYSQTINAKGKYLIPGLIDSHVHLFVHRLNEWAFPEFIKYGVTGVRDMLTPMDSMHVVARWRNEINSGRLMPRVLSVGTLVDGGEQWSLIDINLANTEVEARNLVREASRQGLDFVKVYSALEPEVFAAIADEAKKLNMEISGHIPLRVSLKESLDANQRTNEHMHQVLLACTNKEDSILKVRQKFYDEPHTYQEEIKLLDSHQLQYTETYDREICEEAAKLIAAADQWQVPTLINEKRWHLGLLDEQEIDSLLNLIPEDVYQSWMKNKTTGDFAYAGDSLSLAKAWKNFKRVVKTFSDNGVGFLAGTDFRSPWIYPGFSLHQELEQFVEAGLTPLQALQTATINPTRYLQQTDSLGTVEAGKLADLIILNSNPLQEISNTQDIFKVILNGRIIEPQNLKSENNQ